MTMQNRISGTTLLERFLRYVAVDTQAVPGSDTYPSSGGQKEFARELAAEMRALGIPNAHASEHGYVYAHLPSNCASTKRIAFLAHMDVAPCCRGVDVKPIVHRNFDGQALRFQSGDLLSSDECPALAQCKGHTLITSNGTTLLGADDKSGIAAIMALAEYLVKNPDVKHPALTFCFTPDEEIGAGVDHIDLAELAADFAYTVDGGLAGTVNFETFTAWKATVKFQGLSHHPGQAKGNMVNAVRAAAQFVAALPTNWSPEGTEGREPFLHPDSIQGGVEATQLTFILRGFTDDDIAREKAILEATATQLRSLEPRLGIEIAFKEQYRNMGEVLDRQSEARDLALAAFARLGMTPQVIPIRGGTDGSRLSFMGVPCPNLFTGSTNHHSTREWASLEMMVQSAELMLAIVGEAAAH